MKEPQIPSFLFTPIPNRSDKLRAVEDLRLLELWRCVNGEKPFDMLNAVALQRRLNAQHQARMRKQAEKRTTELEKAEKESVKLHREIAELVFGIELIGEYDELNIGEIGWNTQIRDKLTRKNVGTPRSLLNGLPMGFGWRTHTCATVDLRTYLSELKEKYDNFSYPFSFERARGFLSINDEREHPTLTFNIRLFWKSIGLGLRTRTKLNKLISKYKR